MDTASGYGTYLRSHPIKQPFDHRAYPNVLSIWPHDYILAGLGVTEEQYAHLVQTMKEKMERLLAEGVLPALAGLSAAQRYEQAVDVSSGDRPLAFRTMINVELLPITGDDAKQWCEHANAAIVHALYLESVGASAKLQIESEPTVATPRQGIPSRLFIPGKAWTRVADEAVQSRHAATIEAFLQVGRQIAMNTKHPQASQYARLCDWVKVEMAQTSAQNHTYKDFRDRTPAWHNNRRAALYVTREQWQSIDQSELLDYDVVVIKGYLSQAECRQHAINYRHRLASMTEATAYVQNPGKWAQPTSITSQKLVGLIDANLMATNKTPISNANIPINCLDMGSIMSHPVQTPVSLSNILRLLVDTASGRQSETFGKLFTPSSKSTQPDIARALSFWAYGQAGSISNPHADILNGTCILVLSGLKLWYTFNGGDVKTILKDFVRDSSEWCPNPEHMKVHILEPGDSLVMLCGSTVLHAPVTIEDSLVVGEMFWDEAHLSRLLQSFPIVLRYGSTISNEDIPHQLPEVLNELLARAQAGIFKGLSIAAIEGFIEQIRDSMSCKCRGHCTSARNKAHCPCQEEVVATQGTYPMESKEGVRDEDVTDVADEWRRQGGCNAFCPCRCSKK